MKFRSWLYYCALSLCIVACVSAKRVLQKQPVAPLAHKLPPLVSELEPGALTNSDGMLPEDPLALFQGEIERNITETGDTSAYGYARLLVTQLKVRRTGRLLQVAQIVTLFTPMLLGVPLETYQTDLHTEVQILDAEGTVLGRYLADGHSKVRVAMYYGYSQSEAPRLSDVVALRAALAKIRPQLDTAAARLRPILLAGGPVEDPTRINRLRRLRTQDSRPIRKRK